MTEVGYVSRWVQRIWLGVILTIALALYLAGALPQAGSVPGGDEINAIETALRMGGGVLQPFGLRHGTGLPLLLALEFGLWYVVQAALGRMTQPLDIAWAYLRDPTVFILMGRLTAMAAGLGVMVLLWRLGRRLYSPVVGLLAAAFTGLSVLPLTMIVRFKEELPATLALLAGVGCAAALAGLVPSSRSRRWLAGWAGAWIGVAAAFKYTAAVGMVPVGLAVWWSARRDYLLVGASAALAFLILMPSVISAPGLLIEGLRDVAFGYASFSQPMPPLLTRIVRHVPDALGLPMAILAVVGGVIAIRRQPKVGIFLVAYPVALLLALSSSVGLTSHLMLAVPFLAFLAAVGLTAVVTRLVSQRALVYLTLIVAGVAVVWPTYADACRVVALARRPDTRTLALAWVQEHIPSGSHVLIEGARYAKIYFGPELPAALESLQDDMRMIHEHGGFGCLAQMRLQRAAAHPPAVAFRLTKVLVASAEDVAQQQPDVVITSGYFDRELFDHEPRGVIDVLPCNKPEVQQERRRLRAALAQTFTERVVFDPGVRLHEEFPLMYSGDYHRLRQIPLWGDRSMFYQGPVVTVYQRKPGSAQYGRIGVQ